uniref:Glycoside hydrolase family 5 domain-containing protein n=1 Tax=Chrysotila carterae TaxID=13221 RepID=A0A7S4FDH4_CHRCT|mmetsp:Transcript_5530/g.12045  ORF Transcript_5530/g.12045 Transcript_5530/m.12045 type:complete len:595 (+) Transcript_5530:62-1846(+)
MPSLSGWRVCGACALLLCATSRVSAIPNTINRAGELIVEPRPFDDEHRRQLQEEDNPYTCKDNAKTGEEDWKVMGTNIGGWLVLEPWITPSLFYQFLSADQRFQEDVADKTSMDSRSFCVALGNDEANKQLRRHWREWVREEDIRSIAETGANIVRVPVGDWMYMPYEPFIGCWDGALDELERLLALCRKYNLKVLLDVHAMRGSQNGFDNSGHAMRVKWETVTAQDPSGYATFVHWQYRSADWTGDYDYEHGKYTSTNQANINHSLAVLTKIIERHSGDPVVWGLEPVNEPWQMIPIDIIKKFYWDGYWITRNGAPKWKYVMHDSFRGYPAAWWDFMKGCPNKAMDSHIYQAWNMPSKIDKYLENACNFKGGLQTMHDLLDMPMIVGEWSLATDNCAMWLNGFNDNLPGYPKVTCDMQPCAKPYMGAEQPGAPPDPEEPLQGPYGTGVSGPQFGFCPVGFKWGTQEDAVMTTLAHNHLHAFNSVNGWIFWNFRTELEAKWSFLWAYRNGWFPRNVTDPKDQGVLDACKPDSAMMLPTVSSPSSTSVAASPFAAVAVAVGALVIVGAAAMLARRTRADSREAEAEALAAPYESM